MIEDGLLGASLMATEARTKSLSRLESAILETVAYSDVFDYPLTLEQIHRYLHGLSASHAQVASAVVSEALLSDYLCENGGYFMLAGREQLVAIRRHRATISVQAMPRALYYGRLIAGLPLVRMVALTGSLAMQNAENGADFDYLIVAESGRVWTCRAIVVLLVKLALFRGVVLCPNFIIAEHSLDMRQHDIYTAHELAQMIPLSGVNVYRRLREANAWSAALLPNAFYPPENAGQSIGRNPAIGLRSFLEALLLKSPGNWLERWEMERKIRKLSRQADMSTDTYFSSDWCQGHFSDHGRKSQLAYRQRMEGLTPTNE